MLNCRTVDGTKKRSIMMKLEAVKVEIQPIKMRQLIVFLVGTSPLIMHRFAFKAWQELLYPSAKKNKAERASSLKHKPLEEYQGCFYRNRNPSQPALFHLPNGMPHQALAAAALDIPGAKRTEMERWTNVADVNINLFGVPQMFMSMVRSSDMNRTPDVRTRPIFPKWACQVTIDYKTDPLTDNNILNLFAAAGAIVGMGDWRPQKGGPYGKFRLCGAKDAEYLDIIKRQGRAPQQKAYDQPAYWDDETAELMTWFLEAISRRRQDDDVHTDDTETEVAPESQLQ